MYLMFFLIFAKTEAAESVSLSSEQHSILFYNSWFFNTCFYKDGVFLLLKGDKKNGEGLSIYRWTNKEFSHLFTTTPREGLYDIRTSTASRDGNAIFMSDYLAGIIYKYEPEGKFKRHGVKLHTESLELYNETLLRGNRYPLHNIEVVSGELELIKKINDQLPKGLSHPSEGEMNFNEMLLHVDGDQLYVAYKLFDLILVFDLKTGHKLETKKINRPFPGYIIPDENFIVQTDDPQKNYRKMFEWSDGFHTLIKISVRDNALYGLFRTSVDDEGVWAKLDADEDSSGFVWDNNKESLKLLAIGPNRVLTANKEEKSDGEMVWTLFLNASLPSH